MKTVREGFIALGEDWVHRHYRNAVTVVARPFTQVTILLWAILGCGQVSSQEAYPTQASDTPASIRTKYARFKPTLFSDLPGWRNDQLGDSWTAFQKSCQVLSKKSAWQAPCRRANEVDPGNVVALRQFFEQEFNLFQIFNADDSPAGVITGYYEPQLNGSRSYSPATPYPVYGVPADLLLLDAKLVPKNARADFTVRVNGNTVLPADATTDNTKTYQLDLNGIEPDIRTRQYRLRIIGNRIGPYLTRQEIERRPLASARVIAWVDNRAALYSMQIQGSGRIRLPNGEMLRVGYAEQNGFPFKPSILGSAQFVAGRVGNAPVTTRGLSRKKDQQVDLEMLDTRSKAELISAFIEEARHEVSTSTLPQRSPTTGKKFNQSARKHQVKTPEVDQVIALLSKKTTQVRESSSGTTGISAAGNKETSQSVVTADAVSVGNPRVDSLQSQETASVITNPGQMQISPSLGEPAHATPEKTVPNFQEGPQQAGSGTGSPSTTVLSINPVGKAKSKATVSETAESSLKQRPARSDPVSLNDGTASPNAVQYALTSKKTLAMTANSTFVINNDPSFVFFREVPASSGGPIGALGIPLTAGRSLAVDPRTTPLGYAVFISTPTTADASGLSQLMLAQDTGGAIRGAVRADYFWGVGERAFARANQMKAEAKMWLLMPKGQVLAAGRNDTKFRGIRGEKAELAECLVPDPENCAE